VLKNKAAIAGITLFLLTCAGGVAAQEVDADAAKSLFGKSGCKKCHDPVKDKNGPSFEKTSAKYKGKADAEEKLWTHLTTNPIVKYDDKEEKHISPKTDDQGEIRNLIRWILSH
jgi:cytochrome c